MLKVIHPSHVKSNGMRLNQLAQAINTFGPATYIIYAADLNLDQMRQNLISALDADNQWIIGNFHRKYIHEVGNGHFSPIAAYDQVSDRFLILDVARYKYPPIWVKASDLYRAMTLRADGKK
ncbi:phytochelatin synthase family protein [Gammaproteobacteria bacterium]|nr:phytochelatin synthase family protein [Gammaproteobacteria bacterium]